MNPLLKERVAVSAEWPGAPVEAPGLAERFTLLLLDDDETYRKAAGIELERLGFAVLRFASADALLAHFAAGGGGDLIVLDWKLAGLGVDLLPQLGRRGIRMPVVILAAIPAAAEDGAAERSDKTRSLALLARRIRRVIEAGPPVASGRGDGVLQCGRLLLRPEVSRAYWSGRDVGLTVSEFGILHLMVSRAGEFVSYRAIYDRVHGAGFVAGSGNDGYRTNVRSSIKRIRNKFRAFDDGFAEIENFPAFGYRWRSAVSGSD